MEFVISKKSKRLAMKKQASDQNEYRQNVHERLFKENPKKPQSSAHQSQNRMSARENQVGPNEPAQAHSKRFMNQEDLKKHIENLYKPAPRERKTVVSPQKDFQDKSKDEKEKKKKDKLLLNRLRKDLNKYFSLQALPLLTDKENPRAVTFEQFRQLLNELNFIQHDKATPNETSLSNDMWILDLHCSEPDDLCDVRSIFMLLAGVQNHQAREMLVKEEEIELYEKQSGFLAFRYSEKGTREAKYSQFSDI